MNGNICSYMLMYAQVWSYIVMCCRYLMVCLVIHGSVQSCMVIYDQVWSYIIFMHGHEWSFLVVQGHVWPHMVMCCHVWSCMVLCGQVYLYIVMYGHGHVLSCMGLKGIERRSCVYSYEFVCLTQLCTIRACFYYFNCTQTDNGMSFSDT